MPWAGNKRQHLQHVLRGGRLGPRRAIAAAALQRRERQQYVVRVLRGHAGQHELQHGLEAAGRGAGAEAARHLVGQQQELVAGDALHAQKSHASIGCYCLELAHGWASRHCTVHTDGLADKSIVCIQQSARHQ